MGVIDYLLRRRVKALEDRFVVFEVTNLLVRAGTDWSSEPYFFGPETSASPLRAGIMQSLHLEVAAPLSESDGLTIVGPVHNLTMGLGSSATWTYETTVGQNYASGVFTNQIFAYLATDAPVAEDFTIVSARAAFLIL